MNTPMPTREQIEELVSYLPRLYAKEFPPIKKWHGGMKDNEDVIIMPRSEYDQVVQQFFQAVSAECWTDMDYLNKESGKMLQNEDAIKYADINQLKAMLTYCVREERFCLGHWASMIESGKIRLILERLAELLIKYRIILHLPQNHNRKYSITTLLNEIRYNTKG